MNWYCIYTKPKQEDMVCGKLIPLADISFFNPKIKIKRLHRGRIKETIEALFPRYIFLQFDFSKYYHLIKNTRGVSRILDDGSMHPVIVDQSIIETIKTRVAEGVDMIKQAEFRPGENVIVRSGPFHELEGIFLNDLNKDNRVRILFKVIGYQATVEITKNCLMKRPALAT